VFFGNFKNWYLYEILVDNCEKEFLTSYLRSQKMTLRRSVVGAGFFNELIRMQIRKPTWTIGTRKCFILFFKSFIFLYFFSF
jgi:hypothetical protein